MSQTLTVTTSLLMEADRNGQVENRHWGWVHVSSSQGNTLYSTPGSETVSIFVRSSAKPFQAMPLVLAGFHRDLSAQELAIACASHTASPYHMDLARSLLQKAGLGMEHLGCGPHPPLDVPTAHALIQKNASPTALHNNCSGKHAGMLYYCQRKNLPLETYLDPEHPLQQEINRILCEGAGLPGPIPTGVDGCGAPAFYMPLRGLSRLFAWLGEASVCRPIAEAMIAYPEAISGIGRIDWAVMSASEGKLLSKVGADGVIAVSRMGRGEGLALKIADGAGEIRDHMVVNVLEKLGWLDDKMAEDARLAPFRDPTRKNTLGAPVGYLRPIV